MQKIQIFITTLKRSLFDRSYYSDVVKANFWFSYKYLLLLMTLITAIQVGIAGYQIGQNFPLIKPWLNEIKQAAQIFYPSELEIKVKDGLLTTNVEEPYYIKLPKIKGLEQFEGIRLIAIDTKGSIDEYIKYRSAVLVTNRAIIYPDRDSNGVNSYKVSYLNNLPKNFVLNKKIYDSVIQKINPYWDKIPEYLLILGVSVLILAPFIGGLFAVSGQLVYLLIMTVLILIITKIMKKTFTYGILYRMGMHAISLSIISQFLLELFSIQIPLLYTCVYIVWMILVLQKMQNQEVAKI